jgi:hypothetical protein
MSGEEGGFWSAPEAQGNVALLRHRPRIWCCESSYFAVDLLWVEEEMKGLRYHFDDVSLHVMVCHRRSSCFHHELQAG